APRRLHAALPSFPADARGQVEVLASVDAEDERRIGLGEHGTVEAPHAGADRLLERDPATVIDPHRYLRADGHVGRRHRYVAVASRQMCREQHRGHRASGATGEGTRSEEYTSELQSRENLVCRLLLEK